MKAYFPIPPNIKIKNFKNKIYGSITFLNIPNNRVKPIFFKYIYKDIVFVGIYKLKNKSWVLLNLKKCKPYEFLEISRKDFNVKDNEMIIAVVKKSNSFESYSNILPPPDSLKIDNSLVAQRVSFNFSYLDSTSSFQGEYPFNMARSQNSTFLSFDTFKGAKNENNRNFLILMNISSTHHSSDIVEVKAFNPNNKKQYKLLSAKRNSFSIYETLEYEKEFKEKETIFFSSKLCSFIPIILSLNMDNKLLSVEHVHPPTEYFFGPRKNEVIRLTKMQWIN